MTNYSDRSNTFVPGKYQHKDECCGECGDRFFMAIRKEYHYLRNHA